MVSVSVITDVAPAIAKLTAIQTGLPRLLEVALVAAAEEEREPVKVAVMAETPVSTGALRDSTATSVIDAPGKTILQVTQDRETENKKYFVAPLQIEGHRIVTSQGVDTGRRTEPNPYPSRAIDPLLPVIRERVGAAVGSAVRVMRIP